MNSDFSLATAIAASIVLYAVAAHINYRPSEMLIGLRRRRFWPLVENLARCVYYVGLPYWALRDGVAQARMMGLDSWSGVADTSIAVGLAVAAFVVLAFAWRSQARFARDLRCSETGLGVSAPKSAHWVDALLQAIYLESHWAFYRSGPILWLGGDYYSGSCLGFLLLSVEWLLNPEIRASLRRRDGTGAVAITDWSLALCLTIGFFFSRSLWLMTVLHWWVEFGLRRVRRALATRQQKGEVLVDLSSNPLS
jgi:hypothetical protein